MIASKHSAVNLGAGGIIAIMINEFSSSFTTKCRLVHFFLFKIKIL